MKLEALPTPCAVVDRARLEKNCARMQAIAARHGVRLRPHLKTSKSIDVANLAMGAERCATVSTLEEAAYFAERGILDLTYAVGITEDKLERVLEIERASGARIGVLTDDAATARAIARSGDVRAKRAIGGRASPAREARIWIEIDSGQHRGGVGAESDALLEIARALEPIGVAGVLTHAGHSYAARGAGEIARIAEEERSAAVRAAERIRAAGIACPEVSVGSTPTALHAKSLEGVTELRPGVYVFGDLFQAAIGACANDDIAFSVVASVIGAREDCAWIDAGALALTQDRSMDGLGGAYGEVTALDRSSLRGAPRVDRLNQVHGRVVATSQERLELAVGTKVRVTPNHACLTAAMFDRYYVEEDGEIVAEWPRLRG
jgi:D-serine deaminase-like pyridoxal phosphate-dependent protein